MKEKQVEKKYNEILSVVSKAIGNQTTYGTTLTKTGKKLFGDKYVGTFASNEIPKLKNGDYCIVNLDKSYQSGSHWVAVVCQNNKNYVYDSFGRKTEKILPDFDRPKKDADYDPEQSVIQYDCGSRCIAWIWFADRYGVQNALKL